MKLAEALAERSDCQNRIEELKKRLIRSARVQEGDQPAEDTTELLAETERTFVPNAGTRQLDQPHELEDRVRQRAVDFGCNRRA